VKKAVLGTWAQFMDCPEVATEAINFIAVDWPGQPWTGGSYTGGRSEGELVRGKGAEEPCPVKRGANGA